MPVLERVGPVNSCLQKHSKHQDTQLYTINLLKNRIEPAPVLPTFADVPLDPPEHTMVQKGEGLTRSWRQDLTELVDQFADVFSVVLGMRHLAKGEEPASGPAPS